MKRFKFQSVTQGRDQYLSLGEAKIEGPKIEAECREWGRVLGGAL